MDFQKIADSSWWNSTGSISNELFFWLMGLLLVIFTISVVGRYVIHFSYKTQEIYKNRLFRFLTYCTPITGVVLFAKWQALGIFGIRAISGMIGAVFLIWLITIAIDFSRNYQKLLHTEIKKQILDKYSPQRKRK